MKNSASVLLMTFVGVVLATASLKTVYVQASRIDLKDSPKSGSARIGDVIRGEQLTVLETQGTWIKIKAGKKTGWISRLFVSSHRPVGNADLMKDVPESLPTSSRRRPSSYSVSATARGLMTSERGREGREMYQVDGEALERMEKYSLPKNVLDGFKTNGRLNVD
jgi:hypothetical protein